MPPRTLWTIGYEGHDPESLTATLKRAGIQRVVDVRELPLSRKRGFSKTAMAFGLGAAGIAYTHLRALGTPRAMRHAYLASRGPRRPKRGGVDGETTRPAGRVGKAEGDVEAFRAAYRAHLDANAAALDELESLASKERVATLCVEREVATCHRSVIADAMAERGWGITHLE